MYAGVPTTRARLRDRQGQRRCLAAGDAGVGLDRLFIETRETKVHDAHRTVPADHDVLRFEVAVDDAGGVRRRQAAPGRDEDVQHLAPAARLRAHPLIQRLTLDELHRDVDVIVDGAGVVDRDDVGVRDERDGARFPQQARAAVRRGGPRLADDLQRDPPVEIRVIRRVHLAHPPAPDRVQDLVARDPRPRHQPPDERPRFGRAVVVDVVRGDRRDELHASVAGPQVALHVGPFGRAQRSVEERDDRTLVETIARHSPPTLRRTAPGRVVRVDRHPRVYCSAGRFRMDGSVQRFGGLVAGAVTLGHHRQLFVRQRFELGEMFGFETRNRYEVVERERGAGRVRGRAAEGVPRLSVPAVAGALAHVRHPFLHAGPRARS